MFKCLLLGQRLEVMVADSMLAMISRLQLTDAVSVLGQLGYVEGDGQLKL